MVWPEEKHGGMGDNDFRFEQVIIEETAYARCADWLVLTSPGSAQQNNKGSSD